MGFFQEKRYDAPQPQVVETKNGADYVESVTEKPVVESKAESETVTDVPEKKKTGRPRKNAAKK